VHFRITKHSYQSNTTVIYYLRIKPSHSVSFQFKSTTSTKISLWDEETLTNASPYGRTIYKCRYHK
ncbi:MAG: hypothetical protein WA364_28650, partial [Candidatus Nitrosopolaris sp.]